ncbi:B12-binding domain-containing radical SAM protein [Candidatus Bathyarchaeota archaeon]|nr:B12-binding domain-containing radical SAM protein [Candidatus Bathyarchaeota archaeon]
MKPHVTLVNPPYPSGSHQHPPFTPLGLGYLAAVLEKNQYKVDVIDCQALRFTYEEFKSEISKRQPNIVGITSTTLTYKSALQIAKIAKEACPNCLTLLGGSHVSFWDDKALQECPSLDIVVRKEGENTLLELVQRLEAGKSYHDVIGTTCRKDGKIMKNPDRPYIENLDDLPFPAHHLWPIERLRKHGTIVFPLVTSRGCVYWCDFCTAVRMFGRRYRMRSPKNVVDELEFLQKTFGAHQFTFYDDAFTVDQERAAEICAEIKNRKMKIEWDCETRVDMVTKELLRNMKEVGCIAVWFGVESGSQQVLDAMRKGISPAQTVKAFKWAKEVGLMTVANVVLGFPGETKETIWETIKFIDRLSPNDIGYYIATPYPGTPLYETVKEKGLLKITDFNKFDTATPVFEMGTMSEQELRDIRERAFQRFYLRPSYFFRMLCKGRFWSFSIIRTIFAHFRRAVKLKLGVR